MRGRRGCGMLVGMTVDDPLNNSSYWRNRAEEARTIAESMRTAHPKSIMLKIAEDYDRLARIAEQRKRQT